MAIVHGMIDLMLHDIAGRTQAEVRDCSRCIATDDDEERSRSSEEDQVFAHQNEFESIEKASILDARCLRG